MEIAGLDLFGDDIFQNRFRGHLLSRGFGSSLRSAHLETRIDCSRLRLSSELLSGLEKFFVLGA